MLEESEGIGDTKPSPCLRCELLNKGKVITVKRITQIERVERDDVRMMLPSEHVRAGYSEDSVPRRSRFSWEHSVLMIGHDKLRIHK